MNGARILPSGVCVIDFCTLLKHFMYMQKFESKVKNIDKAQNVVYSCLADPQRIIGMIGLNGDEDWRHYVKNLSADSDSVSFDMSELGTVRICFVEREEPKLIKMMVEGAPFALSLWIQLVKSGEDSCKIRLTIGADLNMFIRAMLEGRLRDAVDRLADLLSELPYS